MTLYAGSILDVPDADCIVNPANSFLRHDGGLAAVIARAAAPLARFRSVDDVYYHGGRDDDPAKYAQDAAWTAEQAAHPLIPTGGAGWTSAGRLPYRGIAHAVGPIWGGGEYLEVDLLKKAYINAARVADRHGCRHVVFPAISCGVFGYPARRAAVVALRALAAAKLLYPDTSYTVALLDPEHVYAFRKALA